MSRIKPKKSEGAFRNGIKLNKAERRKLKKEKKEKRAIAKRDARMERLATMGKEEKGATYRPTIKKPPGAGPGANILKKREEREQAKLAKALQRENIDVDAEKLAFMTKRADHLEKRAQKVLAEAARLREEASDLAAKVQSDDAATTADVKASIEEPDAAAENTISPVRKDDATLTDSQAIEAQLRETSRAATESREVTGGQEPAVEADSAMPDAEDPEQLGFFFSVSAKEEVKSQKKVEKKRKRRRDEDAAEEGADVHDAGNDDAAPRKKSKKEKKSKKDKSKKHDDGVTAEATANGSDDRNDQHDENGKPRQRGGGITQLPPMRPKRNKDKYNNKKKRSTAESGYDNEGLEESPEKTTNLGSQWNVGAVEGGAARQEKFMKLLGGNKAKASTHVHAQHGTPGASFDSGRVEDDLERQYQVGWEKKHGGHGKKGLGA